MIPWLCMACSNFLIIMDSASSAMFCPSYASVSGPFYSSSHPFGSSKITKSTCQYNAMRYLCKVGRAEIHCSGCRDKKDPYPWLPTLKSLAISSFSHSESQRFKIYALRSPKGFGPPPAKRTKKKKRMLEDEEEEDDEDEEQEREDVVIPEIVTNRKIKRMVASVGVRLAIGLTFFPLFYYMKVVLKWSVPDWLPFITSFFTFGSAALGITYGIISTSSDPLRILIAIFVINLQRSMLIVIPISKESLQHLFNSFLVLLFCLVNRKGRFRCGIVV